MACSVCYGYPGCPCCADEADMIQCPECRGTGLRYYDENGNDITENQYNALPEDERIKEDCEHCDGTGEIEDDYEPDYDDRDY